MESSPESTSLIGEAPTFLAMLEHVSRAAGLAKPVLVIGERGTGKELISARLHFLSPRWDQPLVKVNCAALPETILETELFGHVEGAFTGATRDHTGRFERADGGTIVLDELGTIPLRMQEKILRVIEYGEFERVGGSTTIRVDVRVVGATNENLPNLAEQGRFRRDLLDRLAFDVVNVPPLRAREDDILPLAQSFAVAITSELGRSYFPGFSTRAASALLSYEWPGNVRELKNAVERSVYRSTDPDARIDRIVFDPFATSFQNRAKASTENGQATGDVKNRTAALMSQAFPVDLKDEVRKFEEAWIAEAMSRCRYNQMCAAEALGLSYHQLRALLRKYDLTAKYGRDAKRKAEDG
ncbi:MAG: phage shock protein operon transcriptional activator [Gammaproteobacteria bacterium]|jgi:psp operon transcriptional activator